MSTFANLNKAALRQAMRDAGLPYADLSTDAMRAALVAHNLPVEQEIPYVVAPEVAELVQEAVTGETCIDNALNGVVDAVAAQVALAEMDAPVAQVPTPVIDALIAQEVAPEAAPTVQVPSPEVAQLPRGTSKGLVIEKNRPMQNGVRMPSAGGLCRAVWDYLQNEVDHGRTVSAKSVKSYAATVGWNTNNASIEFYAWRKFNGISGRSVA
jgi:hypothetical protein